MPKKPHANTGNTYAQRAKKPSEAVIIVRCTEVEKKKLRRNARFHGFETISEFVRSFAVGRSK